MSSLELTTLAIASVVTAIGFVVGRYTNVCRSRSSRVLDETGLSQLLLRYKTHRESEIKPLTIVCPTEADRTVWNDFAQEYYYNILVNDFSFEVPSPRFSDDISTVEDTKQD